MEFALRYNVRNENHLAEDLKLLKERTNANFAEIHDAGVTLISLDRTSLLTDIQSCICNENTLGIALLLAIQSDILPVVCTNHYIEICNLFISSADKDQALVAFNEVVCVCRKMYAVASATGRYQSCIQFLDRAVALLKPREYCLTPAHALLMQACYSSQSFSYARQKIETEMILEVDPPATSVKGSDVVCYGYFSGLICLKFRNYVLATEKFLMILSISCNMMPAMVLSAYKKCLLISLIQDGKKFAVPKSASLAVSKLAEQRLTEMDVYSQIENYYLAGDMQGLSRLILASEQELTAAGDLELANEVLKTTQWRTLHSISKTFSTISFATLYKLLDFQDSSEAYHQPEESESSTSMLIEGSQPVCHRLLALLDKLLAMNAGRICARIDCRNKMVRFPDETLLPDTGCSQQLEMQMRQCVSLAALVKDMHSEAITTPNFAKKSMASATGQGISSIV